MLSDLPEQQSYQEHKEELRAEQSTMSRDQIKQLMQQHAEATFDPETATPPKHSWVDRGLKLSCEGGNHPHHFVWKRHNAG